MLFTSFSLSLSILSLGFYKRKLLNQADEKEAENIAEEETLTVAIKVLKPGLSVEAESDFEREIEILSSFNHQNIVKLLGICRLSGNEIFFIFCSSDNYYVHLFINITPRTIN